MSLSVRPLLLLMSVLLFSACGGRPTIPVEEYSSVKPPKQKEVYIRATPQSQIAAPVSRTVDRSVQEPVVYEAVEPEPVWRELPPATEPAPRYQPPKRVEPMAKSPAKKNIRSAGDDPLLGLLQKIEQAMQQEDYQYAEGLLERALRIDSQRAGLWHDLGRVRYHQGAYQEAVTLARRSNRFAGRGSVLVEENWSLIARAKEGLGDLEGARAAWRKAGR